MATTSLDQLYQQYLGRAPDVAGAEYWNQQLAGGANLADVERAIAASSEASKLATAPRSSNIINTPTFAAENRDVQFAEPMKVTAAAVSNILKDQQGGKAVGEWVPERVLSNGQIKYKFVGDLGTPKLADVYGIYASLPDTVSSWGELADQISYLQANPQQQLTAPPADQSRGYFGSLALAMDASPTGQLTREQQRAIAAPYYAMTTDAEGNRTRTMKDLMYLQPGMDYYQQIRNAGAATTGTGGTAGTITGGTTGTITGGTTGTITGGTTGTITGGGTTTGGTTGGTTTPGAFLPSPVTTFDGVFGPAMPYNPTTFQMPERAAPVTWGDVNTPTYNPFDTMYVTPPAYNPYTNTTSTQSPFTYPTPAASQPMPQYSNPFANTYDPRPAPVYPMPNTGSPLQYANPFEPAMFAEGGAVNQPGFMEVGTPGFMSQAMSGQMPTYQYPAYGGMPQDVFDWTAPRVSQGKLIQPPRQAPAQFVAPLYTASTMPLFGGSPTNTVIGGTGNDIFAPTPITPVDTVTGGTGNDIITTPPVDYTSAITQAYSDILGRTPDAAGLSYWSNLANQGVSMDEIRRDIQLNENQLISQAYKDILGRDEVDAPGLAYWANSGQDIDTIRRNIQLNKEQQGIAALPVAQGTTTPVAETAPVTTPVTTPVVEPPPPRQYFQTTNYESGEGYMVDLPTPMAGFEADASGGSWYNSSDSSGAVGANAGAEAAAAAADAAASAANNDGPGDGVGSAGNDAGASGQGAGTGAEGQGTE
jgi:hypothetical protein